MVELVVTTVELGVGTMVEFDDVGIGTMVGKEVLITKRVVDAMSVNIGVGNILVEIIGNTLVDACVVVSVVVFVASTTERSKYIIVSENGSLAN